MHDSTIQLLECKSAKSDYLPKSDWLKKHNQANVISVCSLQKNYHSKRWNPLSIKAMLSGKLVYETDNSVYTVSRGKSLLLNADRDYFVYVPQSQKDFDTEIVSVTINFSPSFCNEVADSFSNPLERERAVPFNFEFLENTHSYNVVIDRYLNKILPLTNAFKHDKEVINYFLHDLLTEMLQTQKGLSSSIQKFEAIKSTTRLELYKRLHLVKDYIDSCYANELSLKNLADLAALNPYYLLRLFKQYFKATPHQYITQRRIKEAKVLLSRSYGVSEVCRKVGFEDIASFSKLFKRYTGVPPSEYAKEGLAA
ncbi:MAG: AraC family transcriptional regulator [Flammeovirgaceae bacterium]|nr:AraC family transcriptional regulator [Flammeovirgaceae bacterium]